MNNNSKPELIPNDVLTALEWALSCLDFNSEEEPEATENKKQHPKYSQMPYKIKTEWITSPMHQMVGIGFLIPMTSRLLVNGFANYAGLLGK